VTLCGLWSLDVCRSWVSLRLVLCPGSDGFAAGCYTVVTMTPEEEDYFLNPPPGSAAARAVEFGIDLTLTLENLRLTPEERLLKLDDHVAGIRWLKVNAVLSPPAQAHADETG